MEDQEQQQCVPDPQVCLPQPTAEATMGTGESSESGAQSLPGVAPAAGDGDNAALANVPAAGDTGADSSLTIPVSSASGGAEGSEALPDASAADATASLSASKTVDKTLDNANMLTTVADVGKDIALSEGSTMAKAIPLVGTGLSALSMVNDLKNAADTDDPVEKNMDKAKAVDDGLSMIPGVGTVLGVADLVGKGIGHAIGWDEDKEKGSMMNYATERAMEAVGILDHADSPSEKATKATMQQAQQPDSTYPPPVPGGYPPPPAI